MTRAQILATFIVCAGAFTVPVNAEKLMQWQFEKGQERETEIVQQITQVVNGESLTSSATLYVTTMVDDVNENGSAVLTKTLTRTAMTVAMPGGAVVEYDSATGDEATGTVKMFADVLGPLVGRQVRVTVAKNGSVTALRQLNVPDTAKEKASLFSPMVNSTQFEQLLAKSSLVFPDRVIKDGEKWRVSSKSVLPLGKVTLSAKTVYTYRGEQEENSQIFDRFDVQTTVAIDPPAVDATSAGAADQPALTISDQRSTGELLFDSDKSLVVRSKVEQVLTLAFSVGGNDVKQVLTFVTSQKSLIVEPVVPTDGQAAIAPPIEPVAE